MLFQYCFLPSAVADIFARASATGRLSASDYYALMATMASDVLEGDERLAIERLLYAARRGRVQLIFPSDQEPAMLSPLNPYLLQQAS